MSNSIKSKGIHFEQSRDLDDIDIGYESNLYEITIFGRIHTVATGKHRKVPDLRHTYYVSIYLIYKGRVKAQIGAFEFESSDKSEKAQIQPFLDKEGDLDLNRFSDMIFYHFADDKFFYDTHTELSPAEISELESEYISEQLSKRMNTDIEEEILTEETGALILTDTDLRKTKNKEINPGFISADSLLKSGVFEYDKTKKAVETLLEETKDQAAIIRKEYQKGKHREKAPWIEKYMQNREFAIIETVTQGDCFFDTVRIAFSQIGYNTTIDKLRALLISELTDEQYDLYRTLYINTVLEKEDIVRRMKTLIKTNTEIKKRLEKTSDKSDRDKIIKSAREVEKEYKGLKEGLSLANEMLTEVDFMKGIDTIDGLREFIKRPSFWADAWGISVLEEKLNIKFLIFSEKSYDTGDHNNVFHCGNESNDSTPTPNYYIMTTYSGKHYRLISYKNKYIFKFSEIPYDVKVQVVIKCLERNAGAFYKIQDFRNFKSKLGLSAEEGAKDADEEEDSTAPRYDKDTVFMFYNKSNGVPKAGKGSGELIDNKSILEYAGLNKAESKDWRKKLDDYWIAEFTIDSQKWSSVEHYYQGSKFKKQNPDFTKLFSLDSDSEISKDIDKARKAGSKPSNDLRPANIKMDIDFSGGRNDVERERAVYAKFSQNVDLRNLLTSTRSAKLMKYIVKSPAETDYILMRVRAKLMEEKPSDM